MPDYQITGPDGATYHVTAPEGASQSDVMAYVQSQHQNAQPEKPTGPAANPEDFFGRGMTLGASDYVGAAGKYLGDKIGGALTGKPTMGYEDALKEYRQANSSYREANPWTANGLEIAGGVMSPLFQTKAAGEFTPLGPGGVGGGWGPTQPVTGSITSLVDKGLGNLSQMIGKAFPKYVVNGLQGAAGGAAAGLGNAQGQGGGFPTMGDVGASTGTGAAIGGALGVALPAVMDAGKWAGGKLMEGTQGLIDQIPGNQDTPVGRRLVRAAMRDNPSLSAADAVDSVDARIRLLGPEATLADTGPNMLGVARSAANQPGEALTAAEQLPKRQYGQAERIRTAALQTAGAAHEDELIARRAVATQPLYEQAFSPPGRPVTAGSPQITSPAIEDLLKQPESQAGLKEGMDSIRRDAVINRTQFDPLDYALKRNPDSGQWEKIGTPNLRMLDAMKRGYDIMLQSDAPDMVNQMTGTPTNKARQIAQFRDMLIKEVEPQLPIDPRSITPQNPQGTSTWTLARNQWSQMSKPIEALNAINKVIGKGYDVADLTNRINGSPNLRDKISGLTQDPAKMADFTQFLNNEHSFAKTNRAVGGGSQTQYLRAAQADDAAGAIPDAFMQAAQGKPASAIASIFRSLAKTLAGPPPGVSDQLAPIFSNDPAQRQALIDLMRRRTQVGGLMGGNPGALTNGITRAPGAFVSPLISGGSNQ